MGLISIAKDLYAREWFLRGASTSEARRQRRRLLNQFSRIQNSVLCEHESRELLAMADYILKGAPAGALVECGCYQGGSSAKLSLIAAMTGRTLYVCDSFQGLPEVSETEADFRTVDGRRNGFSAGLYGATIDQVRANIERHGNFEVCRLVKGFFNESLQALTGVPVAFVFSDADLVSSTRDVVRFIWPNLAVGGRLYTHDANLPGLVRGITDGKWWIEQMGEYAPPLFGAGYGCGFGAGSIGYFEKVGPTPPENHRPGEQMEIEISKS
jgi:O-methyltransferase